MAGNPALISWQNQLIPQLYPREVIAIQRNQISAEFSDIQHLQAKWSAKGTLFLTSLRLVFVAADEDPVTGLKAFELPLAFISVSKFNQPIFFCNNLTGSTWTAATDGSPNKAHPPVQFCFYFRNGGVGTFLPLYFTLQERAAQQYSQMHEAARNSENRSQDIQSHVATAFVDPSDPSKLYLTQPTGIDRTATAPVYAPNYGEDEEYQPL